MITQNDLEREQYEARWKAQLDELSRARAQERREQELEAMRTKVQETQLLASKKEFIGQIHLAQRLLNQTPTPEDELLGIDLPALKETALRLEQELTSRS